MPFSPYGEVQLPLPASATPALKRFVCVTAHCAAPPHSSSVSVNKLCKKLPRVYIQRVSDLNKLYDIQPTLPAFVFCNKRLGTPEATGDFLLRKTLVNARLVQQFLQLPLMDGSYRSWHRLG